MSHESAPHVDQTISRIDRLKKQDGSFDKTAVTDALVSEAMGLLTDSDVSAESHKNYAQETSNKLRSECNLGVKMEVTKDANGNECIQITGAEKTPITVSMKSIHGWDSDTVLRTKEVSDRYMGSKNDSKNICSRYSKDGVGFSCTDEFGYSQRVEHKIGTQLSVNAGSKGKFELVGINDPAQPKGHEDCFEDQTTHKKYYVRMCTDSDKNFKNSLVLIPLDADAFTSDNKLKNNPYTIWIDQAGKAHDNSK